MFLRSLLALCLIWLRGKTQTKVICIQVLKTWDSLFGTDYVYGYCKSQKMLNCSELSAWNELKFWTLQIQTKTRRHQLWRQYNILFLSPVDMRVPACCVYVRQRASVCVLSLCLSVRPSFSVRMTANSLSQPLLSLLLIHSRSTVINWFISFVFSKCQALWHIFIDYFNYWKLHSYVSFVKAVSIEYHLYWVF